MPFNGPLKQVLNVTSCRPSFLKHNFTIKGSLRNLSFQPGNVQLPNANKYKTRLNIGNPDVSHVIVCTADTNKEAEQRSEEASRDSPRYH